MLFGILNLSILGYVIATLIMTHVTVIAVTIYLHRSQAHKGVDLHPIVSHFFRLWLWLSTGMETKHWVAIHRKHHATCETKDDPHSPQILGLKKVLLEGAELYRAESKNNKTLEKFGMGTPEDWLERNVYRRFSAKGVILMLLLDVLFFGIPGITIWAVQMMWIPVFAAGIVNGIGHYFGYRNFECADASKNILPIGLIVGGEEFHNNHHTYPTSAKLSIKWWEFDIGWFYIKLFSMLGLAKVKKVAPKPVFDAKKASIDADTVAALITNRFQVMARYSKDVVLPVLQSERSKAEDAGKALFSRAKSLLIRENSLVDEAGKERLTQVFDKCEALKQVYQLRLNLQEIWSRTSSSQKEMLAALQEWCKQAEATGIEALRDFANSLKRYSPQAV